MCLLASGSTALITILLWSGMGAGASTLDMLCEYYSYRSYPLGAACLMVCLLYVLDFFVPPHLPGHFFVLWETDRGLGRSLLLVAVASFLVSCLLLTKEYPSVPLGVTIGIAPLAVAVVRFIGRPRVERRQRPKEGEGAGGEELSTSWVAEHGDIKQKIFLLQRMTGVEADQVAFFKATAFAFFVTFAAVLTAWIIWAVVQGKGLEGLDDAGSTQCGTTGTVYITWATPLIVALANLVYSVFAFLRLYMQDTYTKTDFTKNRLMHEALNSSMATEVTKRRMDMFTSRMSAGREAKETQELEAEARAKEEEYKSQHAEHVKQLSKIVKIVGCTFTLVAGLLYVAFQLLAADSHMATMVCGILGVLFMVFLITMYVTLHRLVKEMGNWLLELPAWKAMFRFAQNNWARALFIVIAFPALVFVPVISAVNQVVRRCRGIYKRYAHTLSEDVKGDGDIDGKSISGSIGHRSDLVLTPRIYFWVSRARSWDWLAICMGVAVWVFIYFCYALCPVLLNVVLAAVGTALENWSFGVILVMTFFIGVVAFLLPPVPGMTVYIFGGLLVTDHQGSPGSSEVEKWIWGCLINIALCWFLKLFACAVQQKLIGGLLGRSLLIRQTVGVHKVAIRCIESVLRKPGLSMGKVAILCGGPDWPTSVLAGILDLSLVQCELGTVPIIFFVAPCAMSGSLYKQRTKNVVWERSANLMIIFSVMVNLALWGLAAWSIQSELESNYHELTRPLKANADLEWLDHKTAQIAERTTVRWPDVGKAVRGVLLTGALIQICVFQALFWGFTYLFGEFEVSSEIKDLRWFSWSPETPLTAIFSDYALVLLGMYAVSWICFLQFWIWRRLKTAEPRAAATRDLDAQEASWKEAYLQKAEAMERQLLEGGKVEEGKVKEEVRAEDPAPVATKAAPPAYEVEEDRTREASFVVDEALYVKSVSSGVEVTVQPFEESTPRGGAQTQSFQCSLCCVGVDQSSGGSLRPP